MFIFLMRLFNSFILSPLIEFADFCMEFHRMGDIIIRHAYKVFFPTGTFINLFFTP